MERGAIARSPALARSIPRSCMVYFGHACDLRIDNLAFPCGHCRADKFNRRLVGCWHRDLLGNSNRSPDRVLQQQPLARPIRADGHSHPTAAYLRWYGRNLFVGRFREVALTTLFMNLVSEKVSGLESDAAQKRLHSIRGDPFLFADWDRVLFLHYAIDPELLRPFVRPPLELDLYEGQAYLSLVAVTMRRFRPARALPFAWVFPLFKCQQFLNVRTYVHHRDEPGALFLWGWLSKPFPLPLPTFDLPCAFAEFDYQHNFESGELRGKVKAGGCEFSYRATVAPQSTLEPCSPGSLGEFTMERYSGFFCRGNRARIFRAWHPAWLQTHVNATIHNIDLLTQKFSWFKQAKFIGANFAPGFKQVSLGRVHVLNNVADQAAKKRHGASSFYEMP